MNRELLNKKDRVSLHIGLLALYFGPGGRNGIVSLDLTGGNEHDTDFDLTAQCSVIN